jgi:hypothetical protein
MKRVRQGRGSGPATWVGAFAALAMAMALLLAPTFSLAEPGDELHEVTWSHASSGSVRSFIVYIAPEIGAIELARQVNVGVPAGQTLPGSLPTYSAIVESRADEYFAVAALGTNGLLSPLSEWKTVQPTQPGQPAIVQP